MLLDDLNVFRSEGDIDHGSAGPAGLALIALAPAVVVGAHCGKTNQNQELAATGELLQFRMTSHHSDGQRPNDGYGDGRPAPQLIPVAMPTSGTYPTPPNLEITEAGGD